MAIEEIGNNLTLERVELCAKPAVMKSTAIREALKFALKVQVPVYLEFNHEQYIISPSNILSLIESQHSKDE